MSRPFADRYSDDYKQGERDFERNGRPDYSKDKYQDENYFGGFEKAKEESDRRDEERREEERYQEEQEERRQHEKAEALRQEDYDRDQQDADHLAQQSEPEPDQQDTPFIRGYNQCIKDCKQSLLKMGGGK